MLTTVDVSNNPLLEYVDITSGGDLYPFNDISEIDLSNNPNIQTIFALGGIKSINLNNNNNNPNTVINVYCVFCFDVPEDSIIGSVCIKVDNVELAQNNQAPYSAWTVNNNYFEVNYTDDIEQCSLSTTQFNADDIAFFPNPVSSGILNFKSNEKTNLKIEIFDFLGRKVMEKNDISDSVNVSTLQKGNYLLRVTTFRGNQTEKLIIE